MSVSAPVDDALARLDALYADLDAELAALAPRCELSGRCCDFPDRLTVLNCQNSDGLDIDCRLAFRLERFRVTHPAFTVVALAHAGKPSLALQADI